MSCKEDEALILAGKGLVSLSLSLCFNFCTALILVGVLHKTKYPQTQ
jgi:hypothetical protein